MKKIIFEATVLILGIMIVISGTQVSSLQIPKSAYTLKSAVQQNNNMLFFGFGNIKNLLESPDFIFLDGVHFGQ